MPRNRNIDKYWANLDPAQKEARKARMREYSRARFERIKAQHGTIGLDRRKHKSRPWRDQMRDYVDAAKIKAGECTDCQLPCEEWNTIMFAWDHVDPATKSFTIAKADKLARTANWQQVIDQEISKCQLLCHNCHSFRTWLERHHDATRIQRPGLPAGSSATTCEQPTLPLV